MDVLKTTKWKPVSNVNIDLCFKGNKYTPRTKKENGSQATGQDPPGVMMKIAAQAHLGYGHSKATT